MRYVSTRGQAPELGFCDAVLAGLATDGGLYVPAEWPQMSPAEFEALANRPYQDAAFAVISRFVDGEIESSKLRGMIDAAYATFRHPSVAPLIEIEPGHFVLELFHGPTLAFKDVAMQLLARLMDHILAERDARATIVGATSGDTGSAAIEAFRGRENTDIFILHPAGGTSEVQRRQMTTVLDANVHNIALEGTFDDCQDAVKAMFANRPFREGLHLSGVNSINWGRIVAQIVYYVTAALALGAPHRAISFTVPTGNFGDIFAGYAAMRMGLPIARLIIATNQNDILARTIETGAYETGTVLKSISPSMDIQVSSNFERLVFDAVDRDADVLTGLMNRLKQGGGFELPEPAQKFIGASFRAGRASEAETIETIRGVHAQSGYILDPHSAVGVHVARHFASNETPMVTLATAHPAKFPAAVKSATGLEPALPQWLSDLFDRSERCDALANDQSVIEDYIRARARA
ncbi:MAG: threonine synthase [Hyphomicrobiaceae bacterium]|nr:threonine synthase [Hyphomicrobiaceae bacterium]